MKFTPLTKEHHAQWSKLLAICFKRSPEDMLVLLDWLHQLGHVVAWGAWDKDKLVAQYTSLLRQLCHNQQTILAGMSINMAVHPDYRGRGLVKKVSAPVYEEINALGAIIGFGFSNAEGVKVDKHSKSYSYRVLGKLHSILSYLPTTKAESLQLSNCLSEQFRLSVPETNTQKIRFVKSLETLKIRYQLHPFRQYQYATADNIGIVIYRENEQLGIRGVSLMDAYGDNLAELLKRWASTLKQNGYHFIHTIATPQSSVALNLAHTLPTVRLPYSRNPHYLTLRQISADMDMRISDFKYWDFIGGDIL